MSFVLSHLNQAFIRTVSAGICSLLLCSSVFAKQESECEELLHSIAVAKSEIWNDRLPELRKELAALGIQTSDFEATPAIKRLIGESDERLILKVEPSSTSMMGRLAHQLQNKWGTAILSLGDDNVFAGSYIASKTPLLLIDERSLTSPHTEGPVNHELRHLIVDKHWHAPSPGELQMRPFRAVLNSDNGIPGLPKAYSKLFSLDEIWAYTGNLREEMKRREQGLAPEIEGHTPSRQLARYLEFVNVLRPYMSQVLVRRTSLQNLILEPHISDDENLVVSTQRGHTIAIASLELKPDTLLVNLDVGYGQSTSLIFLIYDPGSVVWNDLKSAFADGDQDRLGQFLKQVLAHSEASYKGFISESLTAEKKLSPLVKKLEAGMNLTSKENETYRVYLRKLEKAAADGVRIHKIKWLDPN